MKIRNGFVSNSSSSSFVILGVEIPRKIYKEIEDIIVFGEYKSIYNGNRDSNILGILISNIYSDEGNSLFEFDLKEIQEKVENMIKELKLEDFPIKLYTGQEDD